VPLPWFYWICIALLMLGYATLAQQVKAWFLRRWGI